MIMPGPSFHPSTAPLKLAMKVTKQVTTGEPVSDGATGGAIFGLGAVWCFILASLPISWPLVLGASGVGVGVGVLSGKKKTEQEAPQPNATAREVQMSVGGYSTGLPSTQPPK